MHRVYIASVKLKDAFTELRVYKACFFRLVLFPALFFVILIPFHPPYLAFVSLTIQASAPAAAVTSIFASKCGRDAALASKIVAISTLLSILTMRCLPRWLLPFVHKCAGLLRASCLEFWRFCEQKTMWPECPQRHSMKKRSGYSRRRLI